MANQINNLGQQNSQYHNGHNSQVNQGHHHENHHDGPAFSSSALYDIAAHGKNVNNDVALNSLHIFKEKNQMLNKSGNFLGSSFVGIPKEDFRDRMDEQEICSSFILNLKEGQSEENIIIQDNNEEENYNQPQTSVINLQRGISAT